ncbi:hypothetical protein ACYZTL_22025 [Pseudomonas sp. LB3P81]
MSQIYSPNAIGMTASALFSKERASVKRVLGETIESPSGNPATVFIALRLPLPADVSEGDVSVNATSVHKSEFRWFFF